MGGGGAFFVARLPIGSGQGREVSSFPPTPPLPPGIEYRSVGLPSPPFVACCHLSLSRPRLSESSFGADLAVVFFCFRKGMWNAESGRGSPERGRSGMIPLGASFVPPPPRLFSSPTKIMTAPFLVRVPSPTPKHNRKCTKNSRGTAYRSWRPPSRTRPSPIPSSPNSTRRAITATTKRVR